MNGGIKPEGATGIDVQAQGKLSVFSAKVALDL
jgi:hypothetical protein